MSTVLSPEILIPLSIQERKSLILHHASLIDVTHIADEDLHIAYKYGKIISSIAPAYFKYQILRDKQNYSNLKLDKQSQLISSKTEKFAVIFIDWLKTDFEKKSAILEHHPNPRNLFELCGAKLLVTSNSVTRSLSTKMGILWEEIADISPYVIIPEFEFGIKIKGIDIILFIGESIKFAQLKTLKGTLTGSQKNRAKKELIIHDNPLFISAFDLGDWTFNDPKIPRIAGKEFWHNIHIDYDLVETHVKNMLQKIDQAFAELATK
ncbi:hypothetical protein H6G54_12695 [Anabaena cylindrica FACHB-243]|uniref:Uncharacterized protein n=1 Tax=Anabaena cylindrica (strain ATCC 27899 / PCC 7122) TaxID=272123 RepID=K9ZDP8_ANACC|nr:MULTISPECIES: hypothetical protein [Anabaena]AFZ56505.1 hypothetical protein Anacy_0929 [Anabaena cylindrica PCC 7122]MBD2418541.1 hypothetical protein [Anabaena cylindrica FACHB-243]MBY5282900.1 hypothetical protein [Anabaena sp. CCAP 1446/1C]MBY5311112.1 hypothetical protein [Anabaena sp. CCAP 1446/1C]MCM2409945.1 hypothetical protein [Anabaena sp. CCAP 1446/1C]